MSFPTSPTNGQQATVGNITYQYTSATNSWGIVPGIANSISANTITVATLTSNTLISGVTISATGNVSSGNLLTLGQVSATGNVTGNFIYGNGAFLTGITGGGSGGGASISNGATNITIPVSSGNIAMSVAGASNTVVINLGSLTMYGTFAGPKTLNANVTVANAVNAVIFGPVVLNDNFNITVPDASVLYTYSGN
jgi:hypothetical protein